MTPVCHDAPADQGFDHVAITVADVDATVAWYQRVLAPNRCTGPLARRDAADRALRVGASRLSVHPAAAPAAPHADAPTPGSADLCFRFDGPVGEILALLDGGRGRPRRPRPAPGVERRTRRVGVLPRPDGNLLELLTLTAS